MSVGTPVVPTDDAERVRLRTPPTGRWMTEDCPNCRSSDLLHWRAGGIRRYGNTIRVVDLSFEPLSLSVEVSGGQWLTPFSDCRRRGSRCGNRREIITVQGWFRWGYGQMGSFCCFLWDPKFLVSLSRVRQRAVLMLGMRCGTMLVVFLSRWTLLSLFTKGVRFRD